MTANQGHTPLSAPADFIVLNASAGSGKTYSLVQHILMNALRKKDMDHAYQKVLAITFTNNAAAEMKARLLDQLLTFKGLEHPSKSEFFKPIWEEIGVSPEELQQRAAGAASHMLHNYSTLNVGTIDQFTHRLVRTFTRDLDLDDNFEVRLDLDGMIEEALDLLYSSLGDAPALRESLAAWMQERMNREKSHNPDRDLKREGKESFNEDTWKELAHLPGPERMLELEEELNGELSVLVAEGKKLAQRAFTHLQSQGYTKDNFTYYPQAKKHFVDLWSNLRSNNLEAGVQAFKTKPKKGSDTDWEAFLELARAFQESNQRKLLLLKQATEKLQQLSATRALMDKFNALQEEQNTMPLSAFNKLISEELQKEPTAFIYARLGEKFWHFYIDEFQDTSEMQFDNLHPLIEHTLTKDENPNSALIVGDAKQSIYRWRGGRAEQFMALVDNVHPSNRFQQHPEGYKLYSRETVQLPKNFRTYGNIVHFNNGFFEHLGKRLTVPAHQSAYTGAQLQQTPHKDSLNGEVNVAFISVPEGETKTAQRYAEAVCASVKSSIETLLERGHSYNDIALLVRGNAQGKLLANFLTGEGIPVLSSDSLVVGNSFESTVLLSCAKLFLNADDRESRFALAYALTKLGKIPAQLEPFVFQQEATSKGIPYLSGLFPGLQELFSQQESLYTFGARVFEAFGLLLEPNAMVDSCLDLLYGFQTREGSFATLPSWWEAEAKKRNVPAPQDEPAVQVMTIHKSKGLEFDHVILPFGINYKSGGDAHWIDVDVHPELTRLPITKSDKNASLFEPELWTELENQSYFDWMNMVYVAMTRPISGLHVFVDKEKPDELGKGLIDFLACDPEQGTYRSGEVVYPESVNAEESVRPEAPKPGVFSPANLRMAQTAPRGWFDGHADGSKWGTALHQILQRNPASRAAALRRLYRTGAFSHHLHKGAAASIDQLAQHPILKNINESGVLIYTERSIISKDATVRPDLLIKAGNKITVVDYKTGIEKPEHQEQLNRYIELLSTVFEAVDGTLLYL